MTKDLVRLTTADVSRNFPVVSSREIAEKFNKKHNEVIYVIEGRKTKAGKIKNKGLLMSGKPQLSKMFIKNEYLDSRNRKQREYLCTRDGFSLLVMGFTGEKALGWKLAFINSFNLMEKELQARKETRHIGIAVRKSLTDTIKNKVDDNTNFKHWAYSNYSKLIYKKLFGKTTKKLKEERNVPKGGNLRNFLTIEELKRLQETESKVATYIEMRKEITDDKLIYEEVKKIL